MRSPRALPLLLLSATVSAQRDRAPEPKLQPNAISFGTLGVATRVEASFGVFWKDGLDVAEPVQIEAPPFTRIVSQRTFQYTIHGPMTVVVFAIDTAQAGHVAGAFVLKRAQRTARTPVSATVLPAESFATRVLVAETPFEAFSFDDDTMFDAWRRLVATGKLMVTYVAEPHKGKPVLRVEDLAQTDVLLLGEAGLTRMTAEDAALVHGFVCGGGRVVVAANAFYGKSVEGANRIVTPFGLEMIDEESASGATFTADGELIARHELLEDVAVIKVHRPSPTRIVAAERAVPLVQLGAGDFTFIAVARVATGGEVVTLGHSLWYQWITLHEGNERLLRNLLSRSPSGRRMK